jgi:hypothetical protein
VNRWLPALLLAAGCGEPPRFLSVVADPVIAASVGAPLAIQVRTTGEPPIIWTRSGSIPGMRLTDESGNTAAYEGVPEVAGFFSVSINAQDSRGFRGTAVVSLQVTGPPPPPQLTPTGPFRATVGEPHRQHVEVMGGAMPFTWMMDGAPAGLRFDVDLIAITGVPEEEGSFSIVLSLVDGLGRSAEQTYPLEVRRPLIVAAETLPNAIASSWYRFELGLSGGEPPYEWTVVSNALPQGLLLFDDIIEGTPTVPGDHAFTLQVRDAWGQSVTRRYVMTVAERAADPSGALWPIPPFGRTAADFVVHTSSIVDPITRIAWTSAAVSAETHAEAVSRCVALSLLEDGWRLPTWIELASIGGEYAEGIEAPIEAPFRSLWVADGRAWSGPGPDAGGALCVRADPVPELARYGIAYGGELDRYTGLVWSTASLPCARDHQLGAAFCDGLGAQERTDWRQPNVRELLSANGPGTIEAAGFFVDPAGVGVKIAAGGSVETTTSAAAQWCVRAPRFDCTGIAPRVSVSPTYPVVGEEVSLDGRSSGGDPCPIQYTWTITAPGGSTGWPALALLQEDPHLETLRFVPLEPGFYDVTLSTNVDGGQNATRIGVTVDPPSCELAVIASSNGAVVTATATGGVPPYRYAWHREPDYCGGSPGYATGYGSERSLEHDGPPGAATEHRVVVIDSVGCIGVAEATAP